MPITFTVRNTVRVLETFVTNTLTFNLFIKCLD